jgi:hypothetical protein
MATQLTLTDIVRAPLDAIYDAVDERNRQNFKNLEQIYHIEQHGAVQTDQPTFRAKHVKMYVDNKWGDQDMVDIPLALVKNIVQLEPHEVIVDFEIGIDGFRRTASNQITTNASVSDSTTEKSGQAGKGRMGFKITFKNECPTGLTALKAIQLQAFTERHQHIVDNRDSQTRQHVLDNVAYEKIQHAISKVQQALRVLASTDTIDEIVRLINTMQPVDPESHKKYVASVMTSIVDGIVQIRIMGTGDEESKWFLCYDLIMGGNPSIQNVAPSETSGWYVFRHSGSPSDGTAVP